MDLRDSWLRHCGKPMAIWPGEEEGQKVVTHRCMNCPYSERAPGERPQKTGSPFLADLRQRLWSEVAP